MLNAENIKNYIKWEEYNSPKFDWDNYILYIFPDLSDKTKKFYQLLHDINFLKAFKDKINWEYYFHNSNQSLFIDENLVECFDVYSRNGNRLFTDIPENVYKPHKNCFFAFITCVKIKSKVKQQLLKKFWDITKKLEPKIFEHEGLYRCFVELNRTKIIKILKEENLLDFSNPMLITAILMFAKYDENFIVENNLTDFYYNHKEVANLIKNNKASLSLNFYIKVCHHYIKNLKPTYNTSMRLKTFINNIIKFSQLTIDEAKELKNEFYPITGEWHNYYKKYKASV